MTPPLTDSELRAMREREEAATPGPWLVPCPADPMTCVYSQHTNIGLCLERDNAFFIAAARTDVPRLLDEVARLEAALAEARIHLASARLVGSSFVGMTGHLEECDRYDMPPEQDSADGVHATHCTCVYGAMRGVMAFVDRAIAFLSPATPPAGEKP